MREISKQDEPEHPKPVVRPLLLLGIAAYLLIVLAPALMATYYIKVPLITGTVEYGITVSGIIAYAMVSMQFVLGARLGWIEKLFGYRPVFEFHKGMAVVATLLAFAHVSLLVWSRGNWNLVLNPWLHWPVQSGRVAVIALIFILAISFGRKFLPINNADWRWFHSLLAWTILVSGFIHSIAMGSNFENRPFAILWTGYFTIAVLAWSWKNAVQSRKQKTSSDRPNATHSGA